MALDPLKQIDLVVIGGVAVAFLITYFLLRRIFFGPLIEVMERRALRIETARSRRAEAERSLEDAQRRAAALLQAARDEGARLADAAREASVKVSEARRAEIGPEVEAIRARGRDEVLALRRSAETRLAEELCACVGQTVAKMIGRVDERTVRFLVTRTLAEKEAR
ncbi:MAG TPA: hypothetical protein VLT82_17445 [Myxococcaceae bacterium]|nr:hypothetical protein [Myxococcaceae bacterium]